MKKLVFRSGNEVEFTDASTIRAMVETTKTPTAEITRTMLEVTSKTS